MKSFLFVFLILVFTVLLVVGCSHHSANGGTHSGNNSRQSNEHANHSQGGEVSHTSMDSNAKFKAELAANPKEIKAGEQTSLVFTVKDTKGSVVKDLQIVHEQPMHILIVSDDLAFFEHIHPEPQKDGTLKVSFSFPNGGNFKLYADYTPKGEHQIIDRFDVKVAGEERTKIALVEDKTFAKTIDSLNVEMKPSKPIKSNEELMLDFFVTDAQTGKTVTDLQKYLGELAHFVIINESMNQFLHVHPMSDKKSKATVSAHTTFPTSGIYKLWAQFQRGGKVITVPFVLNVAKGKSVETTKGEKGNEIKVTVSSEGYTPSQITVEKDKPVKISFFRKDAQNCGDEVVFASLNIRKKLPVGQTVVVEFTPKESGELGFACGMNMLKGKILVQ